MALNNKVTGEVIITQSVYTRIITDYKKEYIQFLNSNINIYRCNDTDVEIGSLIITEYLMSLFLYNLNDKFDAKYILSRNKTSLNWAMDLFDYYKQKSQLIDKCCELEKLDL